MKLPDGFLELSFLYYGADGEHLRQESCDNAALRPDVSKESDFLGFERVKRVQIVDERLGMKTTAEFRLQSRGEELKYALEIQVDAGGTRFKHTKAGDYSGYCTNSTSVVTQAMKPELSRVDIHVTFFHTPELPAFLREQLDE